MTRLKCPADKVRKAPRILLDSEEDDSAKENVASENAENESSFYYSCQEDAEPVIIDLTDTDKDLSKASIIGTIKRRPPKNIVTLSDEEPSDEEKEPIPFLAYSPPPRSARKPLAILENVPLDADAQVKPRISISLSYEYDASFWDQSHHLAQVDKQTTPSPHKPSASPIKTPSKSEAAKRAREKRQFIANRETLASAFLARFLAVMCDSDKERRMLTLAEPISIIWNKTLNTTAGRATYRRSSHFAFIELSTKVIDCEARLEATLAHELCHLLTWIVSDDFKQPHGRTFKAHAARTQRRMHIEVTTKHDYEIDHKYQWQCSADSCGRIFGRHSKSIDPSKVCCGICRGMLVQIKPKPRSVVVNPETPRSVKNGLTKYKAFLMDRMADVQKMNPDLCYAERVKMIAAEYRVSKQREEGSVKMPDLASLSLT